MNKTRGKEAEVRAHLEQAPRYSNQSMGAVGAAQRTLKGDFLTMRSDLEEKATQPGEACSLDQGTIWPANMRTAYEDAVGGQYIQCAQ